MNVPAKPSTNVVAENVRRYRRARRLTQKDLAAKLGVQHPWVTQIEKARGNISMQTLDKLADALEVPPATLLIPVEIPEAVTA